LGCCFWLKRRSEFAPPSTRPPKQTFTQQLLNAAPARCSAAATPTPPPLPLLLYRAALQGGGSIEDADIAAYPRFCADWAVSAAAPCFRAAQDARRDATYYAPSQALTDAMGLRYGLARAVLYDSYVQHGESGVDGLLDDVGRLAPAHTLADERAWLSRFLDRRYAVLRGTAGDIGAWADSAPCAASLKQLVTTGQLALANPLRFDWWGAQVITTSVRLGRDAVNC
jgi:chitosanase